MGTIMPGFAGKRLARQQDGVAFTLTPTLTLEGEGVFVDIDLSLTSCLGLLLIRKQQFRTLLFPLQLMGS
jgi:hypothetical protein